MRRHRRENKALKLLIRTAAALTAFIAAIVLLMLLIWLRSRSQPPQTDEQVAAIMQRERDEAEPLVIETPEPATKGSIRVFDYDGCCIYAYYGEIVINNDGTDGKEIDIECAGYLEGYEEHKGTEREADHE